MIRFEKSVILLKCFSRTNNRHHIYSQTYRATPCRVVINYRNAPRATWLFSCAFLFKHSISCHGDGVSHLVYLGAHEPRDLKMFVHVIYYYYSLRISDGRATVFEMIELYRFNAPCVSSRLSEVRVRNENVPRRPSRYRYVRRIQLVRSDGVFVRDSRARQCTCAGRETGRKNVRKTRTF